MNLVTAYVGNREGTISGTEGKVWAASVTHPDKSRDKAVIKNFPEIRATYSPKRVDNDQVAASGIFLQKGGVLYRDTLPTFVLLYFLPQAFSHNSYGLSFYNASSPRIESNFFVYGMLMNDGKYMMLNHIWLTSYKSNT
jgi:hypothetical protein